MAGEARQFALQLEAEWAEVQADMGLFVVEVASEALRLVTEKSPVGNPSLWQSPAPVGYTGGTFRANWLVSIGAPDGRSQDSLAGFAAQNAQTLSRYLQYESFPVIYVQNNLRYASTLEDGHSTQAPQGVVALTAVELEAMFSGRDA